MAMTTAFQAGPRLIRRVAGRLDADNVERAPLTTRKPRRGARRGARNRIRPVEFNFVDSRG